MGDVTHASVRGTKLMPREQREARVVEAATEEFGRLGYGAASLAGIAGRAGVSKALVLSYFGSKDDLFAVCVERVGQRLGDHIEPVISRAAPPSELARSAIDAFFAALAERPSDWNLLIDRSVPREGAARASAKRARGLIGRQASQGVGLLNNLDLLSDPDDLEILTAVWMNTVAAVLGWWTDHPDRSIEEMSTRFERLFAVVQSAGSA